MVKEAKMAHPKKFVYEYTPDMYFYYPKSQMMHSDALKMSKVNAEMKYGSKNCSLQVFA